MCSLVVLELYLPPLQEFVPYGRQKLKSHPGVVIPPSNLLGAEQLLVQQLSQVNIDSHKEVNGILVYVVFFVV